jgi:hypothetical protein
VEVAENHGISDWTIYRWRQRYGTLRAYPGFRGAKGPGDKRRPRVATVAASQVAGDAVVSLRRIATGRPPPIAPAGTSHIWAYDFMFDACANGQTLKCLTIVAALTRAILAIGAASSIRSARVIQVLTQMISLRRAPNNVRSGNEWSGVSCARAAGLGGTEVAGGRIDRSRQSVARRGQRRLQRQGRDECMSMERFRN